MPFRWLNKVSDRRDRANRNSRPSEDIVSDRHSQQRSSPRISSSTLFTAGHTKDTLPSNTDDFQRKGMFPFFKLPAELRETIYLFAAQPITPVDTAAIPGTPDRVRIPSIARASHQLRDEALHVLFRNRPIEISLHSKENLRRALLWAQTWSGHSSSLGVIILSGCLEQSQNEFYHITIERSDDAPYFRTRTRPGASVKADLIIEQTKNRLLKWLDQKVKGSAKGQEGRLSSSSFIDMIHLVDGASRLPAPANSRLSTDHLGSSGIRGFWL